jgi:osmoprotectant transport system substrate-binding protein
VRPLILVLTIVLAAACTPTGGAGAPTPSPTPAADPLRVGSGPEAESLLLAHVLAELLREVGLPARVVEFADADDTRRALEVGDVDLAPGYTGEAWLTVLGRADPPSDPRTSYARVREFDESQGILWPQPQFGRSRSIDEPPADATFAFVVAGPPSINADLTTLSELASRLAEQPDAQLCVDPEFADRRDGLVAVLDAYDIRRGIPVLGVSPEDAVLLVSSGVCIAGLTTATDGQAWQRGLRPLVDDLGIFPAFVVIPQVRDVARVGNPGLLAVIAPFGFGLTTARLGEWNGRVTAGEPVEEVAADAALTLLQLAGRAPDASVSPSAEPPQGG